MEWLWLLVLGLGTGAFGIAVGTGGGIILVPLLLIFTGMEPGLVAGTSLALVAVNSFGGMVAYRKLGLIDLRSGVMFAAAAIPGSLVAPFAVAAVSGGVFRVLFACILLGLALRACEEIPLNPIVWARSVKGQLRIMAMLPLNFQ